MVIRTFFDKNNTIQYNDLSNTGLNPVTELYYGGDANNTKYSRFIFYFDETRIKDFYTSGVMPDLTKMKHTLNITNTSSFDNELLGQPSPYGKDRATSFDLILFRVNQDWDEGVGYDFNNMTFVGGVSNTSSINPSNWVLAQNNVFWTNGNGIYSGSSSGITIQTIHFDKGNEDIEIDITDEVNSYLSGGTTNYGLGLAFTRVIEESPSDDLQYVGFFTRHTQTFYQPYVETRYNDFIKDDRFKFYLDKPNKLYLYTAIGGEATNLDNLPTVNIIDNNNNIIQTITATTHVSKGVYSVDVTIPYNNVNIPNLIYNDVWTNLSIGGTPRPDATLEFVLLDDECYFNIGDNQELPKKYGFSISGIKKDERIVSGEIRRVSVLAKVPYTINQQQTLDNLQYRLYVKEGRGEVTVINYTNINRTNSSNYFFIDTASLVPGTYFIEIKAVSNNEVTILKDISNFDIVNITKYK